jgi:hypothetical protein
MRNSEVASIESSATFRTKAESRLTTAMLRSLRMNLSCSSCRMSAKID